MRLFAYANPNVAFLQLATRILDMMGSLLEAGGYRYYSKFIYLMIARQGFVYRFTLFSFLSSNRPRPQLVGFRHDRTLRISNHRGPTHRYWALVFYILEVRMGGSIHGYDDGYLDTQEPRVTPTATLPLPRSLQST